MSCDLWITGNYIQKFIRKILRMRSHESYSLYSFNLGHFFQKLRERYSIWVTLFKIKAIRVYILAKEHDFLNAVICKLFTLSYYVLRIS